MKIIQRIKTAARLLGRNWKALATFGLFWKLALASISLPVLDWMIGLAQRLTGYRYLTWENYTGFLRHPVTLLLALLLAAAAAMATIFDIGAITCILDLSRQDETARVSQAIRFGADRALRIWKPRNIGLMGILLMQVPVLSVGVGSGLMSAFSVPGDIMDLIRDNPRLVLPVAAGVGVVSLLATRWVFAFHCYALEGHGAMAALKRSAALTRGRWLGNLATLLATQLVFGLLNVAALMLLTLLATVLGGLLGSADQIVWYAVSLALVGSAFLATPVSFGCVSALYYRHLDELGEPEMHVAPRPRPDYAPAQAKMIRSLRIALMALILSISFIVSYLMNSGLLNPPIESIHIMEVTAHRGASAFYPENTMAAFRGAKEQGADWVELDVQQTADGQIIVMHDTDTLRTTGVKGSVWTMTYDQISKLDAGSHFSGEYAGEPIPLLSQVVEYARDVDLRLNIELKPTGHETDFEQAVIDIVKAYDMQERCVITSQVYNMLRRVKAIDPAITTVYVMGLAYGSILDLADADHYSIEAVSATKGLVSRVHNAGKQVYAWTVNTEAAIDRMIERNVDNIITDNVELARQRVRENMYSSLLSDYLRTLEEDVVGGN